MPFAEAEQSNREEPHAEEVPNSQAMQRIEKSHKARSPLIFPPHTTPSLNLSALPLPFLLPLLSPNPPTHLQHTLEALPARARILPEPLHARLLDLGLHLLPAAAEGRDLGFLLEMRLFSFFIRRAGIGAGAAVGLIRDGFAHVEDVGPGEVGGGHGDGFAGRVDVRGFEHAGDGGSREEGEDPGGCGLLAGYEAFGAELIEKRVC